MSSNPFYKKKSLANCTLYVYQDPANENKKKPEGSVEKILDNTKLIDEKLIC